LLGHGGALGPFLGLDPLPALLDLGLVEPGQIDRGIEIAAGKYMGVAPNQLAGDAIDHSGEFETPLLLGQLAVIHHLKQQVAQLAAQLLEIALLDGVGDLVGFFQGEWNDARVILLEVPGAAELRVAQPGHEVQKVLQFVHWAPFGRSCELSAASCKRSGSTAWRAWPLLLLAARDLQLMAAPRDCAGSR
jgi:hypothetical protein